MKRKELEELGLEKEVIDKIMNLNGVDVEQAKKASETLQEELSTVKTQLTDANATIEKFGDYEQTKARAEEYKTKFEQSQTEFNSKLDEIGLKTLISEIATKHKVKNVKAITPFLDMETIKASKNRNEDLEKAFETIKTENGYLFDSDEPIDNKIVGQTGKGGVADVLVDKIRSAAGLK